MKKKIWLYTNPHKNNGSFTDDKNINIKPNRLLVKCKDIVYIASGNGFAEKNYTLVVTKKQKLYFDGSMIALLEKIPFDLVEISKNVKVRIKCFTMTNGNSYIFSKYLPKGLKVSRSFKNTLKKHFGFDE